MTPFIHLHVHTQYSLLDGQASVPALVDKALDDGMAGIAITDHGNMFGVKEIYNYVNGGCLKGYKKALEKAESKGDAKSIEKFKNRIDRIKTKDFKLIIGCEMYVANGSLQTRHRQTPDSTCKKSDRLQKSNKAGEQSMDRRFLFPSKN